MAYHFFTRQANVSISAADAGAKLLAFLAERFPYHSESQWRELVASGRVSCNGNAVSSDYVLCLGDSLQYLPLPVDEPAIDDCVEVLYDSPELLVLNKPGNLPCHPAGCFFNHTLWALLKTREREALPEPLRQLAAIAQPHFVNRLDRETSGIVLVAKESRAAKRYAKALQRPQSRKRYLVMVEGVFPDNLSADGWLSADGQSRVRKKRRFTPALPPADLGAETAHTEFRCLLRSQSLSLLSAELFTGRTHQIRATLASVGYPVVGDKLYGVDDEMYLRFIADELSVDDRRRLRLPRQALHAWTISLEGGPGGLQAFCAPMPADMRQLVSAANMAPVPGAGTGNAADVFFWAGDGAQP
ncbi:MAG: RluA family pseudouridine synthase [Lentisphaeria bacterium]|nr:RluA family pseudouridine synthase [Lentisphaeria bacterium]